VVLDELRRFRWPADTELHSVGDPTRIVSLLAGANALILVDAVLGIRPGEVRHLDAATLAREHLFPVSTHGLGVTQALELARRLAPGDMPRHLDIIGIGIERAEPGALSLSPPVAAAVPCAVAWVRAIARARSTANPAAPTGLAQPVPDAIP
jgi:hydrogenase maturation protease